MVEQGSSGWGGGRKEEAKRANVEVGTGCRGVCENRELGSSGFVCKLGGVREVGVGSEGRGVQ